MFETSKKVLPKIVKHVTPWYLRWFYSIFGDRIKMATSSIVPEMAVTSDSVVGVFFVSLCILGIRNFQEI